MGFTTKRGRPKQSDCMERADSGTPELRLKHALGITAEPLDRCLEKGLITPAQHGCGIHFRWLYTIRYGLPTVTALDITAPRGKTLASENEPWKTAREEEYREAVAHLTQARLLSPVMALAVYQETPVFLLPMHEHSSHHARAQALAALCAALETLRALWRR